MIKEQDAYQFQNEEESEYVEVGPVEAWVEDHLYGICLLVFLFIILSCLFFLSPLADVRSFQVRGNEQIPDQVLIDQSPIAEGDSMFDVYWNRHRIADYVVQEEDRLKTASLQWSFWNEYTLQVEELKTIAYLQNKGSYQAVLEDGTLRQDSQKITQTDSPIIKGDGEDKDKIKALTQQIQELDDEVLAAISEIVLTPNEANSDQVTLYMNDGNKVVASVSSLAGRLNYYPAMVEAVDHRTGEFNLETGAYFTPLSEEEMSSSEGQNQGADDSSTGSEEPKEEETQELESTAESES